MKLIFLCAAFACLLEGCDQSSIPSSPPVAGQIVRTDVEPIAKQLPKLAKLQSVWWTSEQVTIDSRLSPPSQPTFKIRGFAQLEQTKAEEFSQQFQWQRTPTDWKPTMVAKNLNLSSAEWSQSASFTKYCKAQHIPGELFFERRKGIIYFDLEVE